MRKISRSFISLPLLALVGVAVTGCSDSLAPAGTDGPQLAKVQNEWIPFDFLFNNNCMGEMMHFVGKRRFLRTSTEDGAGGFHMTFHRNWTGKATGEDTGDVYNINFGRNWSENVKPPYPYTFSQVWKNYITRQGGKGKYELLYKVKMTINANGEVTVDTDELSIECKGG